MALLLLLPFLTPVYSLLLCRPPREQAWAERYAGSFRALDKLGYPPAGLWSEVQYVDVFACSRHDVLGVWQQDNLVAFAVADPILDETHILSLVVHPEWRRRGLAKLLVLAVLWSALEAGQRLVTLEVRESNEAAIALYRSLGMELVGRRPRYYKRPQEDALLLTAHLDQDGASERLETLVSACPTDVKAAVRRTALSHAAEMLGDGARGSTAVEGGVLLGEVL